MSSLLSRLCPVGCRDRAGPGSCRRDRTCGTTSEGWFLVLAGTPSGPGDLRLGITKRRTAVIDHDLERGALPTVLILPVTRFHIALYYDCHSLFAGLADILCQLEVITVECHALPERGPGVFPFPGLLVLGPAVGDYGEISDPLPCVGVAELGVGGQVSSYGDGCAHVVNSFVSQVMT